MSDSLHIGFFSYHLSGNGPTTRTRTIIRALGERTDHRVTVVTNQSEVFDARGVDVCRLLSAPTLADPRTWLRVRRALADCDTVHVPVNCWQLLAADAVLDVPLVAGPGMQHVRPRLYDYLNPAQVIDTHEHIRFWDATSLDWTPIYPAVDRRRFVPYDAGRRQQLRELHGYDATDRIALFVGSLRPFYGSDIVRNVAAADDIEVIACGTGPDSAAFRADPNIDYRGFVPNRSLIDYYNLADVVLVPSERESFCLTALEAAACGTPVITTVCNECVMAALFRGRGTYVWSERTAAAVREEVLALCDDAAYYDQQVEAGLAVFDELNVSVAAVLDDYERVYRRATSIQGTPPGREPLAHAG